MKLQEILDSETVASLPIREAIAVESGTIARAAVAQMRTRDLGCAVVVDSGGSPIGLFTERCLMKMLTEGRSLDSSPVSDCSDRQCPVVKRDDPIGLVWRLIVQQGARFVCVTDDEGRLVGLTGQRGLSEFLCECFAGEVAVQRIGGTPWMQEREGA
jgi:CBS domain-containing protein